MQALVLNENSFCVGEFSAQRFQIYHSIRLMVGINNLKGFFFFQSKWFYSSIAGLWN